MQGKAGAVIPTGLMIMMQPARQPDACFLVDVGETTNPRLGLHLPTFRGDLPHRQMVLS
jgi:hypothetical protein